MAMCMLPNSGEPSFSSPALRQMFNTSACWATKAAEMLGITDMTEAVTCSGIVSSEVSMLYVFGKSSIASCVTTLPASAGACSLLCIPTPVCGAS